MLISKIFYGILQRLPNNIRTFYFRNVFPLITPEELVVQVSKPKEFVLWLRPRHDNIQRSIYLSTKRSVYDPNLSLWLDEVLKPDMTVIEVGAHIGYFSLQICAMIGQTGYALLIEPSPDNFDLLTKNLATNGFSMAKSLNCAIGDQIGVADFSLDRDGAQNTLADLTGTDSQSIEISVETVDSLIAQNHLKHIDLLKIDVEGAEQLVFNGAQNSIKMGQIPLILCEYHPQKLKEHFGTAPEIFIKTIKEMDYEIYRLTNQGEEAFTDSDIASKCNLVLRRV